MKKYHTAYDIAYCIKYMNLLVFVLLYFLKIKLTGHLKEHPEINFSLLNFGTYERPVWIYRCSWKEGHCSLFSFWQVWKFFMLNSMKNVIDICTHNYPILD